MINSTSKKYAAIATLVISTIASTFTSIAEEQIALPGKAFFPEGIAVDNQGGLYVGSLTKGRILYLEPGSQAPRVFVRNGSDGLMSVVGMVVSPDGKTLFACNSDIGISDFKGASQPGLVAFDTKTGISKGSWEFPGGGLCNDLTFTPDGTILMTDSFKPRIMALKPGAKLLSQWSTDERFNTGKGFNLNGITWNEQGLFVVKYNSNELFRIGVKTDGSAGPIDKITLSRPLGGPDGIKTLASGDLLVVEGGTGQLSTIRLDGLNGEVKTISAGLNVPTTVAVFGNTAYIIEGQLDHLPFPNNKTGAPDTFMLKAVELP